MDAYSRDEECYIDVRGLLDLHRASLTSAACAIQSYVRRWFVLRSLLPAATLRRWCTLHPLPGWPHDPARPLSPSNLYLHPVEGGMSWAYCDRLTKFPVADRALAFHSALPRTPSQTRCKPLPAPAAGGRPRT